MQYFTSANINMYKSSQNLKFNSHNINLIFPVLLWYFLRDNDVTAIYGGKFETKDIIFRRLFSLN